VICVSVDDTVSAGASSMSPRIRASTLFTPTPPVASA
jgi:hypothetical protein